MYFDWLCKLFPKHRAVKRNPAQKRVPASQVEDLEVRVVPAIYNVTGFTDGTGTVTPDGEDFDATTLRAAINAANAAPGDDIIVLPSGNYITNTSGEGELYIDSSIEIRGAGASVTVIDNGYNGGRVFHVATDDADEAVTFQGITITGGSIQVVGEAGGGLLVEGPGTVNLKNSAVTGNFVNVAGDAYGGGIAVDGGILYITDSTVSNNGAYGGSQASGGYDAAGGGISVTRLGLVVIGGSTISGNEIYGGTADDDFANAGDARGGGVATFDGSAVVIYNSTIADNHATGGQSTNGGEGYGGSAFGGGIYVDSDAGSFVLGNSTIAYNTVHRGYEDIRKGYAYGGGIYSGFFQTSAASTIIALNTTDYRDADVSGVFLDADDNLIGDVGTNSDWTVSTLVGGNGNPVIDPLFVTSSPSDNGGPTLTLALQATSPAINAGDDRGVLNDQRGFPYVRAFGQADIGAFELQGPVVGTSDGTTAYVAATTAVAVDAEIIVLDTVSITGATVSITGNYTSSEDLLTYPSQIGNITGSYLNGVLTLSGTDTAENYQAAFRSITYANSNSVTTTTERTISFAATDSVGTTTPAATKLIEITVENHQPTVENTIPNQTATEDDPFSFAFNTNTFDDIDIVLGDSLTYSATGLPTWLSFDPLTRTFSGTPRNGDVSTTPVTITVTATDEDLEFVSTTFELTVSNSNDAPTVANVIGPQSATEDVPFTLTFASNTFADVDVGDSLTYSASGLPTWLSFDPLTRTFSGTPTNSDVTATPITITVTATDSALAPVSTTFEMTVSNSNDAPTVANVIPPQTATEDVLFTFTFAADTFEDVDVGDALTYSASGLPAWLSFDPLTRTFSGTPTNADVTSTPVTITVTATDTELSPVSTTFELTVTNTNDAPTVANTIDPQTATEDTLFTFIFDADTFEDIDAGDSLTYSATGLPTWLSFDPLTRTFSGTPTNADVTSTPVTITVTATDTELSPVSTTFELTVTNTNDAPTVANTIDPQTATEDTLFTFIIDADTFEDVDAGDSLTYSATGLPTWLSFDPLTRTFSGTPTNADVTVSPVTITVTATDDQLESVSTTFDLTVTNSNDAPTVANTIDPQTATEDSLFTFTLAADTFDDVDAGDTLTYSVSGAPAWLSFDPLTRTFSGTPANGDVTINPITVTVTATDVALASVSTTFELTVTNVNDSPTVANPIDPQTATEDSLFTFTFASDTFEDIDVGDSLTYEATGLPTWLSFDPLTRTFSGTPTNADVTANPLTITVNATDGASQTVSTTFELTVTNTNDAPIVANVIGPQTATEDSTFTFTFAADTFADVDVGDSLTYSATGLPAWLSFAPLTRTFSGTPTNADVTANPVTITVTATDGSTASNSTTFELSVANSNDAPTVANIIPAQSATEDVQFTFAFAADTFADVDLNDTLTYSVTGMPAWLSFDPETRTFSGTPTDTDTGSGPSTITVTATDSGSATVSTTFELSVIAVNDHAPVFTAETQTVSLAEKSAAGTTVATVHATDADLPPESLRYSITGGNSSGAFSIDPNTGVITVADPTSLVFATNPTFVLTITVTDQGVPSPLTTTATVTVNLTGPKITLNQADATYYIGKARALVDPTASFSDAAIANPDFSTAQLRVSITAGRSRRDVLTVLPQRNSNSPINARGHNIFYRGVKIGTFSGGNGQNPDLVIVFNSNATIAAVNSLLKRINFRAKDGAGQTRTVQFELTNVGGSNSNIATRDINVEDRR